MRDKQICIDCGKQSPETETNYTLISAQFGWRLTRRKTERGDFVVEWRCPECWRKHKQKMAIDEGGAPTGAPGRTPAGERARSSRPPPARSSRPPASGSLAPKPANGRQSRPPSSLPGNARKRP
jgi:hypothetical protein